MRLKNREVPLELRKFRYLYWRNYLSNEERLVYLKKEKGFEGELKFDAILDTLPESDFLILDDLLFKQSNTLFQIDSTLISQNTLYFFEDKNYEGEYNISGDSWSLLTGKEINNPLHQMKRSATLLGQMLASFDKQYRLPIEPHLVFVNPEFTLLQAPKDSPIILPSQIPRYIKKLSQTTSQLQPVHYKLAEILISKHTHEPPNSDVPSYSFESIKKGVHCASCHQLVVRKQNSIYYKLDCDICGHVEKINSLVLRIVEEFSVLFPEKLITVSSLYEWCGGIVSKRQIWRILSKNLNLSNQGRNSYYQFKNI